MATAVNFGKQNPVHNSLNNSQSNNSAKATTFDLQSSPAVGAASNQPQPVLKHLIPAESILKFLPKVNTASTRVHPPSTTTNITAASNAAMAYSNAVGYGSGLRAQNPAQGNVLYTYVYSPENV